MKETETIHFRFVSGHYSTLDELKRDMAIASSCVLLRTVLHYYRKYLETVTHEARQLLITRKDMPGGYRFDDAPGADWLTKGTIGMTADFTDARTLAEQYEIDDLPGMLTKAFIFLEKFKDAVDKGWQPAIIDHDARKIIYLRMKSEDAPRPFVPDALRLH